MDPTNQPKHTLYVNNLNNKISGDEIKLNLYHLFSQYGFVVDVLARKTKKMRGQAFIVFADVASATNAYRSMQGLQLFNKPMRIKFAKLEADIIVRVKDLQPKKRKENPATTGSMPNGGAANKKQKTVTDAIPEISTEEAEAVAAGANVENVVGSVVEKPAAADSEEAINGVHDEMELEPLAAEPSSDSASVAATAAASDAEAAPNNILFVRNLPADFGDEMLAQLFDQLDGFVAVRKPPDRAIGFVEFDTVLNATAAMTSLQGFKVSTEHDIDISYRSH